MSDSFFKKRFKKVRKIKKCHWDVLKPNGNTKRKKLKVVTVRRKPTDISQPITVKKRRKVKVSTQKPSGKRKVKVRHTTKKFTRVQVQP